jgi:hypothetical protein
MRAVRRFLLGEKTSESLRSQRSAEKSNRPWYHPDSRKRHELVERFYPAGLILTRGKVINRFADPAG